MSKVISAHAVSVDGYITGRAPRPGHGLGDGGMLFDWYFDGTVPSTAFDGFKLSEASAPLFDQLAARVGALVAGRRTYEDSERFGGGSPVPNARVVVLSRSAVPTLSAAQTPATTIESAIAAARDLAGGRDVGLMGGGVLTSALRAGLVDEIVLHQVPVLLGTGRPFFQELPEHVRLNLIEAVAAPGVTHLRYEVQR
ncbi:dihydrofolate reductase family protein [Lentzea sp. NBRC 102530]|uniref:dihydrofolate reductase family protein n=1 Tax=Lentzea sp. NBRC 102530 TaxID=3032201 RepID=UPI0024A05F0C|nr:dihydrofolate reductase family protein [Lentzea sp. NBRC 102530]GLY53747.1 riboflavin biosynthesis protein [Lentzea sp. NBRC 102530]